ncbi:MAG: hypothetical protein SVS15_06190 [Thermodesulfobacteriota bacterium]|nr:hypothetical protein [Thermodesulfobacteriota bacterium]
MGMKGDFERLVTVGSDACKLLSNPGATDPQARQKMANKLFEALGPFMDFLPEDWDRCVGCGAPVRVFFAVPDREGVLCGRCAEI